MANKITTIFDFQSSGGLKKVKAEIKEADGLVNKFKASVKSGWEELNRSKTAQVAVGAGAAAMAAKSVQAASDLEESLNAVNVAYGTASVNVTELGEDSAEAFGLSQRAFNEFAVRFSAFADQIAAGSGRQVSDVVEEMTTRVSDFASVYNLSMEEAAQVAQSTLAGETEAFRRFGGDASAATVQAYAYANGIAEAGEKLTEGQKVLARYGVFMEQTAKTQGDFANTSDSLANQQRILKAQLEDTAAEIGQSLIPVMSKLAETANKTVVPAIDGALSALDGLFEYAEDFGARTGAMFGGDHVKNREFVEAVTNAEREAAKFDRTLLDGVTTFDEARSIALEHAEALGLGEQAYHMANLVALDYKSTVLDLAEAEHEHASSVSELNKWVDKAAYLQEQYEASVERKAEADEEAADAAEAHRDAVQDLFDTIQNNMSTMFDYEDSMHRMVQSSHDLADDTAELEQKYKDGEISQREYEDGLRDLAIGEHDLAREALKTSEAYAEQKGAQEGTVEYIDLQRKELERLAEVFPILREEIDLYITELDRMNQATVFSMGATGTPGSSATFVDTGAAANTPVPFTGPPSATTAAAANAGRPIIYAPMFDPGEGAYQAFARFLDETDRRRGGGSYH